MTDSAIDLTNFSTVFVEWENDGSASASNVSRLVVGEFQDGGSNSFTERLSKTNTFARTEESLDVSGVTGSFFIRAHARDDSGASNNASSVRVYKLWLEP